MTSSAEATKPRRRPWLEKRAAKTKDSVATDRDGNPAFVGPRWVREATINGRARRRRQAALKRDMAKLNALLREHAIKLDILALGGERFGNVPVKWYQPDMGGDVLEGGRLDMKGIGLVARMLGKPFLEVKRAALVCLHQVRGGN